ncbi:MAG TPA: 50S ribosomal protein L11 methyltransferase [Anaerolineae bacterium]|nr:50S ribosomal protein L11 methyltransferase [Anaerolineae bacterium]
MSGRPVSQLEDRTRWADFQPMRIGRRWMVTPSWLDLAVEPPLLPIRLDPGSVFGRGDHPTTRLCLLALERHLKPGAAVLDLGTGTGILAIAAAKIGSGRVLAVDTDAEAVRVAQVNAALNGVASIVRMEKGSLAQVRAGQWDLAQADVVIANILAHVIITFFEQGLAQAITPKGLLVVSGILHSQTPEIRARLQWHGLELMAEERLAEWSCMIVRSV